MSQVAIDDIIPRTQLIATAGQTVFNTNWTADAASDVLVYARADGVEPNDGTQLVSSSLYGVTFIGGSETVRVTFLSGRTLDDVITIVRNTPAERTNLYINTNFVPSMLNQDFGILTLVDQQAQMYDTIVNPRYNVSATIDTKDEILPILGANQIWAMNNDNDEIVAYDVPASGGLAPDDATYILKQPHAELPDAQAISDLASGIIIGTTTTGVLLSRILTGVADQTAITNGSGIGGNPTVGLASNPIIPGTAGMGIPQGTTGQRVTPVTGIGFRFNTSLDSIEYWDGIEWTQLSDNTDLEILASHLAGEGASLIGLQDQSGVTSKTVQDLANAKIIAQTDNGTLTNGQFLSALATGLAYVTTATGVIGSRILTGTANQIDIANGSGAGGNPTASLSSTLNLPGTFNIQSSNAISSIINDSSMNTATTSNISTSAAIKAYVDSLVTGLNIQGSCVCASTVALTVLYANGASGVGATLTNAGAQAAISLDGVSPTVGQRVLIKDQALSLQNGIYTVTVVGTGITNWVLTRATDYDTAAEINAGDLVIITGGTTQTDSSWVQTATVNTVGVDSITFVQFTASLPVNVASGGTGKTSFTAYAPIVGGTTTTGSLQSITLGASGTLFQSAGVGVLPAFTTATYPSTAGSSGTILRSNGSNWVNSTTTFADTYAINTLLYNSSANTVVGLATQNSSVIVTSSTGVPSWLSSLTNGQLVIGSTGATPVAATLTAGSGVTITNAAGSITIAATTSAMTWSTVSGTTQSAAVNNGYIANNAGAVTVTLPTTFAIGDTVIVKGLGAGGWILAAGTSRVIRLGSSVTSSAGSLTSANRYDTVKVTGLVANSDWSVDYALSTGLTVA